MVVEAQILEVDQLLYAAVVGLVAAVVSLTSAIVYLYMRQTSQNKETREKLKDCEHNHEIANAKIIEMAEKIGELKGYHIMYNDIMLGIKRVASEAG